MPSSEIAPRNPDIGYESSGDESSGGKTAILTPSRSSIADSENRSIYTATDSTGDGEATPPASEAGDSKHRRERSLEQLAARRGIDVPEVDWNKTRCIGYRQMAWSATKGQEVMKWFCETENAPIHLVLKERSFHLLRKQCKAQCKVYGKDWVMEEVLGRFLYEYTKEEHFPIRESSE
jgi:hypothetical protein